LCSRESNFLYNYKNYKNSHLQFCISHHWNTGYLEQRDLKYYTILRNQLNFCMTSEKEF